MASWKGKTSGSVIGHKIFIFLLKHFGLKAAYALLRFVSFYYIFLLPRATRHIYHYFRNRIGFSFFKSIISIYRNYYVFGQGIIDKIALYGGVETNFNYSFDGDHHLRAITENGRGAVLVSAHIGNWEIASAMLKELNTKINIVLLDAEHERIKHTLDKFMKKRDLGIIAMKSDLSHIYKIAAALQNNEIVCFHGDRFVDGSATITKTLLGAYAKFPQGPFKTIQKLKVPYSFVFAFKTSAKHYALSATPGKLPSDNINEIYDEYIEVLEKKIKEHPLQWFNYYDFWDKDIQGAQIS